jgi:hypothetical protein
MERVKEMLSAAEECMRKWRYFFFPNVPIIGNWIGDFAVIKCFLSAVFRKKEEQLPMLSIDILFHLHSHIYSHLAIPINSVLILIFGSLAQINEF